MKKMLMLGMAALVTMGLSVGCSEDMRSDDYYHADRLLPDTKEYTDTASDTTEQVRLIAGMYASRLSMVYYDANRTTPQLYFTAGEKQVSLTAGKNGRVRLYVEKFHTHFMPLYLTIEMEVQLQDTGNDTIWLKGHDGVVRTSDEGKNIGMALPESDDAELDGYYLRSTHKISALIDLMLPIPMKAQWEGEKQ